MFTALQDLRFGLRILRKNPCLSLAAIVTLALGIGVNTVIFSGVYTLFLKPLPYVDADRIFVVSSIDRDNDGEALQVSFPDFSDWKSRGQNLGLLAAAMNWDANLVDGSHSERIHGGLVSREFFELMGASPAAGRTWGPEDPMAGADRQVVISDALWQRLFNRNPDAVGRTLELDGDRYVIAGVMTSTFQFPAFDVIGSLEAVASPASLSDRTARNLTVFGTAREGSDIRRVRSELDGISAALEQEYPASNSGVRPEVLPLRESLVGKYRTLLIVLQWAVGFVLLIACANLANLLLAQTAGRTREFGIRFALGAKRRRVVTQLLSESLVLSVFGGALSLLLARWLLDYLQRSVEPSRFSQFGIITIDFRMVIFTAAACVLTSILFGLLPALAASQPDLDAFLRESGRGGGTTLRHRRVQNALVIAEVALTMILLTAAGLMIRTFQGLIDSDPGFRTKDILTMRLTVSETRYPDEARTLEFFKTVEGGIKALPGVESAAAVTYLPLIGYNRGTAFRTIRQTPDVPPYRADIQPITPEYLQLMQIPFQRGRLFDSADLSVAPAVAIVNRAFVRKYLRGEEALGSVLQLGESRESTRAVTIVGVTGDVNQFGVNFEPRPEIFIPSIRRTMYLVIATSVDAASLAQPVADTIRRIDPNQTVFAVRTMADVLSDSFRSRRILRSMLTTLGAVALAMVTLAIYGVIAYSVTERAREIGVRMALGADRRSVLGLVVRSGMRPAMIGIAAGLVGALGVTRVLKRYLYGVSPADPLTFGAITLIIAVVALAACYLPARRATHVDPIVVLRCD